MVKKAETQQAPKTSIDKLHKRVNAIFGYKGGLEKPQLETLKNYISQFAERAKVNTPDIKVYKSDMDAVLRMMKDNGMVGVKGARGESKKSAVDLTTLGPGMGQYLQVLAATVVHGFVQRSDATEEHKEEAKESLDDFIMTQNDEKKFIVTETNRNHYTFNTDLENVKKAHNHISRSGLVNGTVRTGLGVLTFAGIVASVKAIFRPNDNGERKTFWQQVGNIAKAAGFAFVMYHMVYQGRGLQETKDATVKSVRDWSAYIMGRRENTTPAANVTRP